MTDTATTLRNVRPWGGAPADVTLSAGRIDAIVPHDPRAQQHLLVVDGRGRLLVPSFSDVHVHLDSTRLGLPFRPHTAEGGIWNMVMDDREHWRDAGMSVADRAAHTLGLMVARGTTRVRSYAQIDVDCKLEKFEGVLHAKQVHADRCDVTVMAFPQAGLLREGGTVPLFEEALRSGAQVMGGIDPCQLDRDPVRHLDIVFGLAEKHQVPVDIHLHEPGELGVFSVDLILERTRALGMQGRVTISHGYPLGGVSEPTTRRLIEDFAELDISMATVAPSVDTALPLVDLTEAGVRVGLGEDGQRDYWSPYGNADMLDRTWQLAFTNKYRRAELLEHCLAVATWGGATVLDPAVPRLTSIEDRPGLAVGDPAELLIVEGESVAAAVMDRSFDRTVIHDGHVVANALELIDGE
ncbi:amidohydrolase family protein [Leekyejoonella antrihumi]|uniref:Amidohydrolase family protein n=1 Tax=Leekyejoonella antrihumi TaxID=1660198 RepID=A0A563DYX0_9MICO|nr:amidohydrolase family protein [Leekyejoonella antrihumi]TWP35162.1 amidohydrolase family protein [Leekyejoonella antrihumi]